MALPPRKKKPDTVSHSMKRFRRYVESLDDTKVAAGLLSEALTVMEALYSEVENLKKKLSPVIERKSIETQTEALAEPAKPAASQEREFVVQTKKGRPPKEAAKPNSIKSAQQKQRKPDMAQKAQPVSKSDKKQAKQTAKAKNSLPASQTHTTKRPKSKKEAPKARPEALIVGKTDTSDMSYADILKDLRSNDELKEIGEQVSRVRRTQKGSLFLELKPGFDASKLVGGLSSAVGTNGTVKALAPTTSVEARDLDEVTTPEEVAEAIKQKTVLEASAMAGCAY
uniref:Uncharacterized protein n=1 Tax=Anopheles dirus TaxID=7168 RepID=A0A182NE13_9DIPT